MNESSTDESWESKPLNSLRWSFFQAYNLLIHPLIKPFLSLSVETIRSKHGKKQPVPVSPRLPCLFLFSSHSFTLFFHRLLRLWRLHSGEICTKLTLRVQRQLAPNLPGQLSHLLVLQQLHHHGVHPTRRGLRTLPMPGRPLHAGLRHVRRSLGESNRRAVPPNMWRSGATGGVLRQVRQRHLSRGGGQDCGVEEMWTVHWVWYGRYQPQRCGDGLVVQRRWAI